MTKTQRIRQITIETQSVTVIRTTIRQISAHCEHCRETVAVFTPERSAAVLQKNITEISSLIESGELHLTKFNQDALICGGGLSRFAIRKDRKAVIFANDRNYEQGGY